MNKNIVMLTDSYKYSHSTQYPKDIVGMYDYMEARGGVYNDVVFTGLQYYVKKYLSIKITKDMVDEAHGFTKLHGVPFDLKGWMYIVNELKGQLPVKIRAAPEGTVVPLKTVLMTIESTDKTVPWIAGWLETLLMKVWYSTNISSKSYNVKQMLSKYGSPEWVAFSYHNFSDRGCSSVESAAICGYAHLTQFMGTDNFNSLKLCKDVYGADIAGFSVFASEHSTCTSNANGSTKEEINWVIRMLKEHPDAPIMSFVADSYDVYNFTNEVTRPNTVIRDIMSRREQKFVIRPDSGNPLAVLPKMLAIMENNNVFDIEIKGQDNITRKASSKYGILWGDGISPETIEDILKMVLELGYAAENMVFGSGGDLGQKHNRDTLGFAVKCSSITLRDGTERDVFKDPITDKGKTSKKGKVTTFYNTVTKEYFVGKIGEDYDNSIEVLETIYDNGIVKEYTLDEIRERSL